MILIHLRRAPSFILLAILCTLGAGNVFAQRANLAKISSEPSGPRLNRIFSSSGTSGPLGQDRTIAAQKQLLLFWSEPPANATTYDYDAYHFQIMNYLTVNRAFLPTHSSIRRDRYPEIR